MQQQYLILRDGQDAVLDGIVIAEEGTIPLVREIEQSLTGEIILVDPIPALEDRQQILIAGVSGRFGERQRRFFQAEFRLQAGRVLTPVEGACRLVVV